MFTKRSSLLITLPLVCGLLLYFFSGHTHLAFFPLLDSNAIARWLVQHLPDALWTFSLTSLLLFIWKNELTGLSLPFILAGIFSGLIFEMLQKFGVMKGTFDVADIVVSIAAGILAVLFSKTKFHFKNHPA